MHSKIKLVGKMQDAIYAMNYIKALDTGIKQVSDIKAKNYYHFEFIKQVQALRGTCAILRKELENWFELEKIHNLEVDLQMRANYKAIKNF